MTRHGRRNRSYILISIVREVKVCSKEGRGVYYVIQITKSMHSSNYQLPLENVAEVLPLLAKPSRWRRSILGRCIR